MSELSDFFNGAEIENAGQLVINFHGRLAFSEKLSDADVVLLSTYMLSNKNKTSGVNIDEVKALFVGSGRKEDNFRKVVFFLSSGASPRKLQREGENLLLTFSGIAVTKKLLNEKEVA